MTKRKKRSLLVGVVLLGVGAAGASGLWRPAARTRRAAVAVSETRQPTRSTTPSREALEMLRRGGPAELAASAPADPTLSRQQQEAQETARTATELERLAAAVGLTEQQRTRASRVLGAVEHARSILERHQDQDDDEHGARLRQLDQQEHLALLAVVTTPQQPLLDAYFQKR